ncbi:polyserase-2-like isoform X2 [Sminthopsis crassicaudata]|uniref:polyserase-2-like isoform X2 n=1 Tax=Sminthopsis crassicaudata TaxID=9301 RepID=UPI003D684A6A
MHPAVLFLLLAFYSIPGKTQYAECGRPLRQDRIVGGSDASLGKWPWHVSVNRKGSQICGGTLISKSWVISAAHCFISSHTFSLIPPKQYTVAVGLNSQLSLKRDPDLSDGTFQIVKVSDILVHENYSKPALGNDIALLHLAEPLNFTDYVRPICLPRANHSFPHGASCWATGWGDVQESEPQPIKSGLILQQLELKIIGPKECQCLFKYKGPFNRTLELLPTMLCAGYKEGRRDTCQGDSGGPLVCEEQGQWFLAGITSFGQGCGRRNRPGVFANVVVFEDWIRERVEDAVFSEQPQPIPTSLPEDSDDCTIALPECGAAPRPGDWPWKAVIITPVSTPCHGVLVAEKWVLAPASCFLGLKDISTWHVMLPPKAQRIPVLSVQLNVNYIKDFEYDLALLELAVPVSFTDDTRAVCLPRLYHYFLPSSRCHLIQWGRGEPPMASKSLMEAEMTSSWWCYCLHDQKEVVPNSLENPKILCAEYHEEEKTSCWMGSRWGLLCKESGSWFLAGISKPPEDCLRPRVFSPLQLRSPWITHVALTSYMEDQLNWEWPTVMNFVPMCPPHTQFGACGIESYKQSDPWPWVAEVHGARDEVCMANLVSPGWVLTDTHCVARQGSIASRLRVNLGRAHFGTLGQVSRPVSSIQYTMGSPLVLLQLETRVEISASALPVCLHSGPVSKGIRCWVLGWKDSINRVPMAVQVSILTPQKCPYLNKRILPLGTICVAYHKKTIDRFETDSGSSLVCQQSLDSFTLMGISIRGSPELFAPVGVQQPWISRTVGDAPFVQFSH